MSLCVLGIGSATPPRQIAQTDAARLAADFANAAPGHERTLAAIYRQTRIQTRGSVLLEDPGTEPFQQSFFPPANGTPTAGPTTAERMARYAAEAGGLALAAATSSLRAAGTDPAAITHLVTCSCTGFANPGVDLELVSDLGLPADVARTHVGFMGCHGAFNALRVADAFASADPRAVVLVCCVELCSLHFQYGSRSDSVVANSIFADGAAAIVGVGPGHPLAGSGTGWQLGRQWSRILPDSIGEMGWIIGDHGFEMNLSARVPAVISRDIGRIVTDAIAEHGLRLGDVAAWAVHPGGPRVIAQVQEALGLDDQAVAVSREILAAHGNMSSATILFILERLLHERADDPCVALAFGPGLTVEAAVFDRGLPRTVRPR
jgi:predicted naringenin-chalcone synthase